MYDKPKQLFYTFCCKVYPVDQAFFVAKFCHLVTKNKMGLQLIQRIILDKNGQKSLYFKETKVEFAIFRSYRF